MLFEPSSVLFLRLKLSGKHRKGRKPSPLSSCLLSVASQAPRSADKYLKRVKNRLEEVKETCVFYSTIFAVDVSNECSEY